jgi:hypothetical protein
MCFNGAKKRKEKKIIYYVYVFYVFLVAWHVMTKEIGEIVSEMEENININTSIYGCIAMGMCTLQKNIPLVFYGDIRLVCL